MEIFKQFGIDIGYVVIGMAAVILILFIMLIIYMVKNSKLHKKYQQFMAGEDGKNLEKAILDKFMAIDKLQENVTDLYQNVERIDGILVTAYQKFGLVKYDAFSEIGGKLSFALALLTEQNNGFILNSVHSSREGCYTYIKKVKNGTCDIVLSEEENQALEEAKTGMIWKEEQ